MMPANDRSGDWITALLTMRSSRSTTIVWPTWLAVAEEKAATPAGFSLAMTSHVPSLARPSGCASARWKPSRSRTMVDCSTYDLPELRYEDGQVAHSLIAPTHRFSIT